MGWFWRGPWAILTWIWGGIVLLFYGLFAILSVLSWFEAEPTVYNNNPPGGGNKTRPKREAANPGERGTR